MLTFAHYTWVANSFMHRFLVLVEVTGTSKNHTTLAIVTFYLEFFMVPELEFLFHV